MRRPLPCFILVLFLVGVARAAGLPAEQRQATVRFIQGLRNEDGGYRPTAEAAPSQLAVVVSALRGLKYQGGAPVEPDRTRRFVLSCFDEVAGGFGDTPGAPPSVRSTAMGLMALAELK